MMHRHLLTLLLMAGILPCYARGESGDAAEMFRRNCAALAQNAEQAGSMAVAGRDGWFFLTGELRHIGAGTFWGEAAAGVSRAAKPDAADPLPAILDFNGQLKKIGVELIIVPVPPKAVVYHEMLPGATSGVATVRLDAVHRDFYAHLRARGVAVLDLTDCFLRSKNASKTQESLYCRQDSHWSGSGCVLAAEQIAAKVNPFLGAGSPAANPFKSEWQTVEIQGDLCRAFKDRNISRETIRVRKITGTVSDETVASGVSGKIILLGDSHNLVFHAGDDMLCSRAGLPDQLAFELKQKIDLVAVRGSGATPARVNLMRRARQHKGYWQNKQCVIWCFAAREFTESDGWRKVPIE
jgi:alginate O-acetyltransferase complex protein AlgJ